MVRPGHVSDILTVWGENVGLVEVRLVVGVPEPDRAGGGQGRKKRVRPTGNPSFPPCPPSIFYSHERVVRHP